MPSNQQTLSDLLQAIRNASNNVSSSISAAYEIFSSAVNSSSQRSNPLVIDLDNDGLELTSWQNSGVQFDLNGDGAFESTGWVSSQANGGGDAFLAIDKDNNGNIDGADELFSSNSGSGFDELRKFDSNVDNKINSSDSQFNLIKIWQDKNSNGVVDDNELSSLGSNNIVEISLNSINNSSSINGNLRTETAEVKLSNGETRVISEILFGTNGFNSSADSADDLLAADFQLSNDSALLPYSKGYGSLNSWQVAMTLDSGLLQIAQELNNLQPKDFYQINSRFEAFLFKWAGVENATETSVYQSGNSDGRIDPRKVAFLEKITDLDFRIPNPDNITQLQNSWTLFYDTLLAKFLTQGTFKGIFPDASYSFETDAITINTTLNQAIANILSFLDILDKGSFLNYAYYSKTILQLNRDQFNDSDFDAKVSNMINSIISSVAIDDFSFDGLFNIGNDSSEVLYGSNNSDILKGQDGDDTIYAGNGSDYIEGGRGNDYLRGEAENDIYKFNIGDGQDVIEDSSGIDKIIFGEGIIYASLTFVKVGNDLVISVGGSGDRVGIKGFYVANTSRIESVVFSSGAQFNLTNLGDVFNGGNANDTIIGTAKTDILSGGDGDDIIYGHEGNDIIAGGKGNDNIDDQTYYSGNNIYVFNVGDGQDVIYDATGNDKIVFGDGITRADIVLEERFSDNYSLVIKIGTNGDQISIGNFFYEWNNNKKIEVLEFFDGSTMSLVGGLTLQGTNSLGETIRGTAANDVITGNVGNDSIDAGAGNDRVTGGKGDDYILDSTNSDDIYIFNIGDGADVIEDFRGNDKIVFGAGISRANIVLEERFSDNYSLIIKIGTNGDQITLKYFFNDWSNDRKIETLEFADGSTMSLVNGLTLQGSSLTGETIRGTTANDVITGNIGNDSIDAGAGNDRVTGGKGDDYILDSTNSDDIYIFNIGDGADVIEDSRGNDKIVFGDRITNADIVLEERFSDNYSLVIKVGTNGDQITLKNFFYDWNNDRKIETLEFADGSTMSLVNGLTLQGTNPAGETIRGTTANDVITGNIGNDSIDAGAENDRVTGGKGNDYILDSTDSNDTYVFNIGDGADVIEDFRGNDKIVFGAGISRANIVLEERFSDNYSLIIKIGTNGDQITLKYFFNDWSNDRKIETLEFADGSNMSLVDGLTLQGANPLGETIRGTAANDIITGNIGADTIEASDGNDRVTGGKGNDSILGGDGYDIYVFNIGDGSDIVADSGGNDKIVFGAGIAQSDIRLVSDYGNNGSLIIKIGNNGDQITIRNFFNDRKIETLEFADGVTIDLSRGLNLIGTNPNGEVLWGTNYDDVVVGGDGNDSIYTHDGNDTITGGKGDDSIDGGGSGNETYIFNLGDGKDNITDYSGNDKIIFGAGINKQDILMESSGADLIIKIKDTTDQITINRFFNGNKIEYIQFNDESSFAISDGITVTGSASNDTIIGTPFADNLSGGAGDDYIYSGGGADILDGGSGNDDLRGGADSDNYLFSPNHGRDLIYDDGGLADAILFSEGISSNNIVMLRNGNNLVLSYGNAIDLITITNFFASDNNRIEYLQFSNGEKFNLTNVLNSASGALSYSVNGYNIIEEDVATQIKLLNLSNQTNSYSNISFSVNPANGSVIKDDAGDIIYTPNANYNGNDSFAISYTDSLGNALTKVINVEILPTNDAPTAVNLSLESNEDSILEINPLASVVDVDAGDVLSISAVTNPIHGTARIESGKIIYTPTPNANFSGSDSFSYSVSDNNGGSDTKTITLNILPVNDVPIAQDDSAVTNEDQAVLIDVTSNDSDVETGFFDSNSITIAEAPAHGVVEIRPDGKISYRPNTDYSGLDSFKYTVTDSQGAVSNQSVVNLVINAINDAPKIIENRQISCNEDEVKIVNISDYFYDPENDNFTITSTASENGNIDIADGKIYYIPNHNFNGIDPLTFTVTDSNGASRIINLNAVVNAVNDAPIAQNDNYTLVENGSARFGILNNDSDAEDVLFTNNINNITTPAHGSVTINSDATLTYTPNADYTGHDSFSYTITDSSGLSSTAQVNIDVTPANRAPSDIAVDNLAINENVTAGIIGNIVVTDNDPSETQRLTVSDNRFEIVNNQLKLKTGVSLDYETSQNISLSITSTDSHNLSLTKQFNVVVNNVNEAPTANNISALVNEDNSYSISIASLLTSSGSRDPEGGELALRSVQSAANGSVAITDGNVVFTPDADYNGNASFTFTIVDSGGLSVTKTANITVNSVNDLPIIISSPNISGNEDVAITITPSGFDVDGDLLTLTSITQGSHGVVTFVNNDITYTPQANYNGSDRFTYTISDGHGGIIIKTVNVTINPVNDAPIANLTTATVNEDSQVIIDPLATASDVDGGQLSLTSITQASHGLVAIANQKITYTPQSNYNGSDSFTYTISDGQGGFVTKTVAVTVNPVNDAPTINSIVPTQQATIGQAFSYQLNRSLFSDIDGDTLTVSVKQSDNSNLPSWLTFNSNTLELKGTPPEGSYGLESLLLVVSDASSQVSTGFNLIIEKSLSATSTANTVSTPGSNGHISTTSGSSDFVIGSNANDIIDYSGDAIWENSVHGDDVYENFAQNSYTLDLVAISGKSRSFDAFNGRGGSDTLNLTGGDDVLALDDPFSLNPSESGSRFYGVKVINGNGGNDVIDFSSTTLTYGNLTLNGGNGQDVLWGNDGDDIINGFAGNDNIIGGRGNDTLNGGDGNDVIKGYDGNDNINGGRGADQLSGGLGKDIFFYDRLTDSTSSNSDIILDFIHGEDKISLINLNLHFNNLDITHDISHDLTIIKDHNSDFEIKLSGQINLDQGDFV